MPETPTTPSPSGNSKSWINRKVGNVPIIYIVGAGVFLLVVLAFMSTRTPKQVENPTTGNNNEPSPAERNLARTTTVVTAPTYQAPISTINGGIETNEQWLAKGIQYLISKGISGGMAQAALQKYLQGADLSYQEGTYRDLALKQFGAPPNVVDLGKTRRSPLTQTPPNDELINWADPKSYASFYKRGQDIIGVTHEGREHHVQWNEWQSLVGQEPDISKRFPDGF